jgi:glutamyl-tRNA synthetase
MSDLRLRFCPSPTGLPHVGMIRTALFNWAYTRNQGGKLIFRIEDTDIERDSEESYNMLLDSLKWVGIDWDEGVEIGGDFGPYRQSQRMDIYKKVVDQLLEGGYAYYSYSTQDEIKARNKANGLDEHRGYDGYDRNLTEDEVQAFKAEGREPVIRFQMPDTDCTFNDLVRGEITFNKESTPDFVIVRGNGHPLYTLVNPVDDALMNVDIVMRGEDLLSSTPRQIALYDALIKIGVAKATPKFAHLPYVMGEGNKKLSKRDPESNLFLHKKHGMIPEGLNNYLSLLGWSISPDNDIFTMDELVSSFDINKVNPNPARFDPKKCIAINAEHLRRLAPADFRNRLVPYLYYPNGVNEYQIALDEDIYPADYHIVSAPDFNDLTPGEQQLLDKAAPLIQTRIQLLGEAPKMLEYLFVAEQDFAPDESAVESLKENYKEILQIGLELLKDESDWTTDHLHELLAEEFITKREIKPKFAFTPFQVAITGKRVSPPLFESMEILGKDIIVQRISNMLN